MKEEQGFLWGCLWGCIFGLICIIMTGIIIQIRPNTEISQEILRNVQQSTNIVEALKKENLVIRKLYSGSENDTVEIVVEYDFLYKNSKKK